MTPITYTLSAGVGDVGLRGLQLARINTLELGPLKLRNVPCMIKDPPLRNLPVKESESLSPLALGFSMIIDYQTRKITFGKKLAPEQYDFKLPLRMHRLAMVRGMVDGTQPANFVVDTGGEVISISQAVASSLNRPGVDAADCPAGVRIVGLGQGRVPDAGRRPELRSHPVHELPGGRAESATRRARCSDSVWAASSATSS